MSLAAPARLTLLATSAIVWLMLLWAAPAASAPAASSNGLLVFDSDRPDGLNAASDVFTMAADGSGVTQITDNGGSEPAWNADGTKIAFGTQHSYDPTSTPEAIYSMNPDGSGKTLIVDSDPSAQSNSCTYNRHPSWSPDGTKLAVQMSGCYMNGQPVAPGIFVVDIATSTVTRLTDGPADNEPAWSHDGAKIAFSRAVGGPAHVFVMDADGENVTQLTTVGSNGFPTWSPDDSKIALESNRGGNNYDVWIMDADGGNPVPVTDIDDDSSFVNVHPNWSPDGTKIAFASNRVTDGSGDHDIYVIDIDGSDETAITANTSTDVHPQWQPAGGVPPPPPPTPGTVRIFLDANPDGPQDFSFTGSGAIGNFDLDDDSTPTLPSDRSFTGLAPGGYSVQQIAPDGWAAVGLTCDDPDGGTSTDVGTATATIDLDAGETVACQYLDVPAPSTKIVIEVDAVPDDPQNFSFTGSGAIGSFDLDDDADATLLSSRLFPLSPGSYSVQQTAASGWNLTDLTCDDPDGGSSTDLGSATASIDLDTFETVRCTYTDTKPALAPPSLLDTDPDSPADDNNPRVKGSAAGAVNVRLYTTSDCSGTAVQGTAAEFASPGLPVTVADNSSTTFRATAVDVAGTVSACSSSSITYVEQSLPPPSVSIADVSRPEGTGTITPFSLTVSLSAPAPAGGVTVDFATGNGSAVASSDYAARSGVLTFVQGEDQMQITVQVVGDSTVESDETFFVSLSNPSGATMADGQGKATIVNDDGPPPSVSIDNVSMEEGTGFLSLPPTPGACDLMPFTFTASLSRPAPFGGVSIDYATANGTATGGSFMTIGSSDYFRSSGRVSFAAGERQKTVEVGVVCDGFIEPDETFFVNLTNPSGATIRDGQGRATIVNDDFVQRTIGIDDVSRKEGDSGMTRLVFTASLSAPAVKPVTVEFVTANGTALTPVDYVDSSGELVFSTGERQKQIIVQVLGDAGFEPDETFFVDLVTVTGATITDGQGQGTILNDDDAQLTISVDDVARNEGNSGITRFTFTASLTAPAPASGVTVAFATANGTASAPSDYLSASGQVGFAQGERQRQITVQVVGDTSVEPGETLFVNLSTATGATIADGQGQGTILNDDGLPTISIDNVSALEGDPPSSIPPTPGCDLRTFMFTVLLSRPAPFGGVSVDYATADGTATGGSFSTIGSSDYFHSSGRVSFAAGERQTTIAVDVVCDRSIEPDETFFVNLSNPSGATIRDGQGRGTIKNDD